MMGNQAPARKTLDFEERDDASVAMQGHRLALAEDGAPVLGIGVAEQRSGPRPVPRHQPLRDRQRQAAELSSCPAGAMAAEEDPWRQAAAAAKEYYETDPEAVEWAMFAGDTLHGESEVHATLGANEARMLWN